MVMVRAGTYGGWGWDGAASDRWLDEFLDTAQGKNKLSKLGRAQAAERHLVIVLDPFSPAGMGIPLALTARHERGAADYGLPSFVPRLGALGIESIYAVKAKAGSEGKVMVQAGTYGGWGWDGTVIDRWLGEFLASDQGKNKLGKLGRGEAAEQHPGPDAAEYPERPDGSVRLRRVAVDPHRTSGEAAMAKVAGRTRQRPGLVGQTAGARCGWRCSPPPWSSAA